MKLFTFYWLNGRVTESYGDDLDGALTIAGYGSYYASVALDFYTEDKPRERHYYDKEARHWVARRKLRFTMARPEINAKIQAVTETTHVINEFNPELVRELVGDLSTVSSIDFNDTRGNVVELVIGDGGLYLGGVIKKFNYVGFAEYHDYSYDEEDDDEDAYHFISNAGQYFPLGNEQDAFEYWLAAAAAGMKTDYNGNPKGSCDFKDIPVYVHQR